MLFVLVAHIARVVVFHPYALILYLAPHTLFIPWFVYSNIVYVQHDDVIEWKHFPRYWPFVRGIRRSQRPVARGFDVFFNLCLYKPLNKQSRRWWFETPSRSLWRHCNEREIECCETLLTDQYYYSKTWSVHFSGISTCGRTSRETVSHPQCPSLPNYVQNIYTHLRYCDK